MINVHQSTNRSLILHVKMSQKGLSKYEEVTQFQPLVNLQWAAVHFAARRQVILFDIDKQSWTMFQCITFSQKRIK